MNQKIKNIIKITGKGNFLYLIFLLLCLMFLSFLEFIGIGAIPIFMGIILDPEILASKVKISQLTDLINSTDRSTLTIYISILLVVIFFIKNIFYIFIIVFQGQLTKRIKLHLSSKLYIKYLNLDYLKLTEKQSSIMIRTITLDGSNASIFVLNILNLFRESLLFLVICSLLFLASPIVSIYIFVAFGMISLIFFFLTHNKIFKQGKFLQRLSSDKIRIINNTIGSIKEIKIFKLEKFFHRVFFKNYKEFEKYAFRNYFIRLLPRVILEIGAVVGIVSIIIFYIYLGEDLTTLLPFLSLVVMSIIRIVPSLNQMQTSIATLKAVLPSYNHVIDQLDAEHGKNNLDIKKNTIQFKEKIIIKDINFNYPSNNINILNNTTMEIFKGDKIGIIGKSGSGKTTLVSIILGLIKPTSGEILIDGANINFSDYEWNNTAGYVPQEIFLLEDTIKNNITLGLDDKNIDLNFLEESCKAAQINNFIDLLPLKFDTMVGERGYNISAGQRQRLGIARVLYRNPSLLILDESTSSLDEETEKNFVNDLFEVSKNKTIIFISHRLSALKKCDKIYDLNKSKFI